jgi:Ca2+-binding RTX toxin-like protein
MNADGSAQTRLTHTTGLSDAISGGSGSDKITGGAGNDRLNGGRGRDSIAGNAGNDTILARDGFSDRVLGGPGVDRAQVDARDRVFDVERRF